MDSVRQPRESLVAQPEALRATTRSCYSASLQPVFEVAVATRRRVLEGLLLPVLRTHERAIEQLVADA